MTCESNKQNLIEAHSQYWTAILKKKIHSEIQPEECVLNGEKLKFLKLSHWIWWQYSIFFRSQEETPNRIGECIVNGW